jgi:quercetin dioxygenase-like cupin family protein
MSGLFFADADMRLDTIEASKVSRKIKAFGEKTMMVEVYFEKGAIGAPHEHPHEQLSYCLQGSFDFDVGTLKYRLEAGDSILIPSGSIHGVLCRDKGRLLDMFSPPREDFLSR